MSVLLGDLRPSQTMEWNRCEGTRVHRGNKQQKQHQEHFGGAHNSDPILVSLFSLSFFNRRLYRNRDSHNSTPYTDRLAMRRGSFVGHCLTMPSVSAIVSIQTDDIAILCRAERRLEPATLRRTVSPLMLTTDCLREIDYFR